MLGTWRMSFFDLLPWRYRTYSPSPRAAAAPARAAAARRAAAAPAAAALAAARHDPHLRHLRRRGRRRLLHARSAARAMAETRLDLLNTAMHKCIS